MLDMMRSRALVLALVAAAAMAGCDDDSDPAGPTPEEVAGTYTAATFTIAAGGTTIDLLEQGATFEITLNANGTTQGQLFVPDIGDGGGDLTVDLEGTWRVTGDRVRITTGEDVFIDDVDFQYLGDGRMITTFSNQGESVVLALERS